MSTITGNDSSLVVLKIYPKQEEQKKNLFVVPHGKYTDVIANKATVSFEFDVVEGMDTIKASGLTMFRDHKAIDANEIGIGPHKLLNRGMVEFLNNNIVTEDNKKRVTSLVVEFPLVDYLLDCRPADKTGTKVTKQEKDNFRRKIHLYLKRLFDLHIKDDHYDDLRILSRVTIRNGMVRMEFGLSFSGLLAQFPLTTLPLQIYQIDDQHPVAYQIALKLYTHTGNDNNVFSFTAGTLSTKSILASTSLPGIAYVREKRYPWERMIKEPFMQALDYLIQRDILEGYEFYKEKGEKITDEEINAGYFSSYEKFANTIFKFSVNISRYHLERVLEKKKSKKKLSVKEQEFVKIAEQCLSGITTEGD